MGDTYIVAFKAGSSGRLVANLIWGLITESVHEYHLTDFNSTHNFTPYATSFDISEVPVNNRIYSSPETYKYFKFTNNPGIITLHAYPDFDVIRQRFPTTKIVIVSYSNENLSEITGNSLIKNGIEALLRGSTPCNDTMFFSSTYKSIFGEDFNGQEIPLNERRSIFNKYQDRVSHEFYNSKFVNPVIPDDFLDKTLILSYDDLCNDKCETLNKLYKLTNSSPKSNITELYEGYLQGRNRLIESCMPWVDKYVTK